MPVDGSEDGQPLSAIELPAGFFSTPREKPQPALQPAQVKMPSPPNGKN